LTNFHSVFQPIFHPHNRTSFASRLTASSTITIQVDGPLNLKYTFSKAPISGPQQECKAQQIRKMSKCTNRNQTFFSWCVAQLIFYSRSIISVADLDRREYGSTKMMHDAITEREANRRTLYSHHPKLVILTSSRHGFSKNKFHFFTS
jgi:hypothetical protein